MARRTVHRGPDDEGAYADGPLAFGMRRLSIIDVAGGHQPLSNEDGTLSLDRQRRDLQLPGAAQRAHRAGPSLPHRLRLRNHRSPVRAARRCVRRAFERHVRVRAVGCAAPAPAARPRPAGHQAAVPVERRSPPDIRQRSQGDPRAAGDRRGARSGGAVVVPDARICAGAAIDIPRHTQARTRDGAERGARQGRRAPLLAGARRRSTVRRARTNGSPACAPGSRNRCACRW